MSIALCLHESTFTQPSLLLSSSSRDVPIAAPGTSRHGSRPSPSRLAIAAAMNDDGDWNHACVEFIFRCKRVSKTWCTLVSDPDSIGRFLSIQSEKQTLITHTLVNTLGQELLTTDVFVRLRSFFDSKREYRILATYNDLVLCSTREDAYAYYDYHICNPRTLQLLALPPGPPELHSGYVSFICEPY